MPDPNVEIVRRAYDAWNWYGVEALASYVTDDVVLEDAPEVPDAATWRGREAVLGRLADVAEAVGGGWVELRDIATTGEGVLVQMTWKLDDSRTGTELSEVFHLVELADGRIARIRVFLERPGLD